MMLPGTRSKISSWTKSPGRSQKGCLTGIGEKNRSFMRLSEGLGKYLLPLDAESI
jgi:hypothetical protein